MMNHPELKDIRFVHYDEQNPGFSALRFVAVHMHLGFRPVHPDTFHGGLTQLQILCDCFGAFASGFGSDDISDLPIC